MKFKSDIEVEAGIKDSSGAIGTAGQVLSSTGSNVSWVTNSMVAERVQHRVKAGVAINKGQAVYVTGADGTNVIVGKASNASEATSSKTLGLIDATVAVNGFANVVEIGELAGLNTIGSTVGDPVWLGTDGNLIYGLANKPYAPQHLVFIGIVTRVNSNNGEIFINVQNGFELNEIHDVDIKTEVPINGDILGYNGTLWVNKTIAEWLGYVPADDALVVHKAGDETITGAKIFTATSKFNSNINLSKTGFFSVPSLYNTIGAYNTEFKFGIDSTRIAILDLANLTSARTYNYPDKDGIFAMTSDLHSAVTIGTANGLSLSGQELSLGLSSTSTNGALSSTDWNTFNNKQGALSGTGFVKISGTTISYDNSTYALDNAVVHLEGTETISGVKTFSSQMTAAKILMSNSSIDRSLELTNSSSGQSIYVVNTGSGNAIQNLNNGNSGVGFMSANSLTATGNLYQGNFNGVRVFSVGSEGAGYFARNVGIGTTSPAGLWSGSNRVLQITAGTNISSELVQSRPSASITRFLSGTSDTFGVYTTNALNYEVYTSGLARMRITSGGNLGIGTTTDAGYKLDVNGTGRFSGKLTISADAGNEQLLIQRASNANQQLVFGYHSDGYGRIQAVEQNAGFKPLALNQGGGNVGVGTTSPLTALTVSGNLSLFTTNQIRLYNSAKNNWAEMSSPLLGGDTEIDFKLVTKSGVVYVNPTGNVGIGETNPSEKLTINSGNIKLNSFQYIPGQYRYIGTEYATGNGNNKAEVRFGIDGSDTYTFLSFATASGAGTINERMKIYANGNIAKLTLTGIDGTFDNVIKYGHPTDLNSGNSAANRWIGIDATVTAGAAITNALRIRAYGGGTGNAAPVNVVDFRGDLSTLFYGNVTAVGFFNSSDIKLKELTPYEYNVSNIKPITYLWKDSRDNKKHIGYSAQEVQKVMPDAVNEDGNGYLSVNYIEVLVAKIAELENRIKQLEK